MRIYHASKVDLQFICKIREIKINPTMKKEMLIELINTNAGFIVAKINKDYTSWFTSAFFQYYLPRMTKQKTQVPPKSYNRWREYV